MTQDVITSMASIVIRRGLLACGLLLGLTGCPEHDPPVSVAISGEPTAEPPVPPEPTLSTSLIQRAYLKASNPDSNDLFGYHVALDGDTLVIAAPGEGSVATGVNGIQVDNSASRSGAVYVFTRSGGGWTQQAYLKASNTGAVDLFGETLALSGDTLAVGATNEDSSATGVNGDQTNNSTFSSGAVYVFTRNGGVWTQQAYLKASNTGTNDLFGSALSMSGDTLVVGAFGEDSSATGVDGIQTNNSASNSGAVYVFTRNGGAWTQQAYLKASNTGAADFFGSALALDGDTLAVGATDEDSSAIGVNGDQTNNSASNSGAVYVFTRSGGVWMQQAYLKASNTGGNDSFGGTLALSGDTLAVGAKQEDSHATGINGDQADNSALNSGAVYVFTRMSGVWAQQAYVKASNTDGNDLFGGALALDGDILTVGAKQEDSHATGVNGDQADNTVADSGAVYVFRRSGGVWMQQTYLKASNTGATDFFGSALALDGDTLVVGATDEDSSATGINGDQTNNSATNSGAIYIFQ